MWRHLLSAVLSVSLLFWSATAASAEAAPRPEIERVVRAFGAVELLQARFALHLKASKSPMNEDARKLQAFARRVVDAQPSDLSAPFMQAFSSQLSTREATEMADALESPMGAKIIRMSIDAFRYHGGDIIAAKNANPFSTEEKRQVLELGEMPGWKVYERLVQDNRFAGAMMDKLLALPMFDDLR